MTDLKLPPDASGSKPNCGLVAIAVVAGCTLTEATEAYQKACESFFGRRMQGNWRGRTFDSIRNAALLESFGISLYRVPVKGMTLTKLVEHINVGGGDTTYIVTTTGHAQVVKGEYVIDQCGPSHISEYWGRRKRVRDIVGVAK